MINKTKQTALKSDKPSEIETKRNKDFRIEDDLISSLQNKRENRRARQVFEWENARRNNLNIVGDFRDAA